MPTATFRWLGPNKSKIENFCGLTLTISTTTPEITTVVTFDNSNDLELVKEGMRDDNWEYVEP